MVTSLRDIFKWLKCSPSDYPSPEQLTPVPFDNAIFEILPSVTDLLKESLQKESNAQQIKKKLSKKLQKIDLALSEDYNKDNDSLNRNDYFNYTIQKG